MKSCLDPTFKYQAANTHSDLQNFKERMEKYKEMVKRQAITTNVAAPTFGRRVAIPRA